MPGAAKIFADCPGSNLGSMREGVHGAFTDGNIAPRETKNGTMEIRGGLEGVAGKCAVEEMIADCGSVIAMDCIRTRQRATEFD